MSALVKRTKVARGVVDTSVLVADIAGFKLLVTNPANASSSLLRLWVEEGVFVWLISEEILTE